MSEIFYEVLEKHASVRHMRSLLDLKEGKRISKKAANRLRSSGIKSKSQARSALFNMKTRALFADHRNANKTKLVMSGPKLNKAKSLANRIADKHGAGSTAAQRAQALVRKKQLPAKRGHISSFSGKPYQDMINSAANKRKSSDFIRNLRKK